MTCECRKGAVMPGCERHDPQASKATNPSVSWWPKLLWNDCYRGIEIGTFWIGWTNPAYKRKGW